MEREIESKMKKKMKMKMDKDIYYRYQMTYPYESTKVYRSKDFNKVVNKCYNNFKTFDGMEYGMFCVTNLDKNIEYKFQVKKDKIVKLDGHKVLNEENKAGGSITPKTFQEEKLSNDSDEYDQNIFSEITLDDIEAKREYTVCNII